MKRILYTLLAIMLTTGAWAQNVAKIGETEYETLADAVAAVPRDGSETTITMLADADVATALTIANTQKVILDLNGITVKNDASKSLAQLITVNGLLTIDDSSAEKNGVIKNTASGKYVIKTGTAASVLTLNNGIIETTTGNSNGAVYGTNGSFVMTGGKIIAAGTGVTSKNVNISGGEVTATAGQALCAAGTITGGKFTSTNNNAVYANQSGALEITGGNFSGVTSKPTINIYTTDVKVTGATLNNGVGFASNATAMILSGTDAAYLTNTHAAFYDSETLVGYAPINTGIFTNAKVSGKTVKLTTDVATTTYLNVTKSFTLDLNGHNIACTPSKADAVFLFKGTASAPVNVTIMGEGNISCSDHGEGCNIMQVSNYSIINIEGGNYTVPGDNSSIYLLATAGTSTVNITGGKFQTGDGKYILNIKDDCRSYSSFNVTGGTFVGFDPADNIAEGLHTNFVASDYKSVDNGDGTYSVVPREYVAQINETKYETLAAAVAAATEGQTVTLLEDITLTDRVEPNGNITIDLGGKTITTTATCGNGSAFDVKGGNVTIKNGTIDGTQVTITECDAITARSGSNVTLEGLNITINSTTGACAYAFDGGHITINSGTYKNLTSVPYPHKDGFKALVVNQANVATQLVTINGGSFVGQNPADGDDGNLMITYLPENLATQLNAEGFYEIVTATVKIGVKGYATIAEALDEVKATETIKLLADAQIETINDWKEGVNLDKNDHVLKVNTFNVEDNLAFNIPFDFVANTATYTRAMPTGTTWGTVCLPFTLKSNDAIKLYQVASISGSTMTVTEITEDVQPGTPVIFKTTGTVASFTTTEASVSNVAPATTGTLIGTYSTITLNSDLGSIYFINGDKFHQAKASLTVPAYRAYINYTATGAKPSILTMSIGDNEATTVENIAAEDMTITSIYNANGQLLAAPQKGLNIINRADGKTVKLIIK